MSMRRFECNLIHDNMERVGIYQIDEVLPFIVKSRHDPNANRMFNGYKVKMWSLRYQTFQKNLACVSCGLKGQYFALEKSKSNTFTRYHFNLYAKLSNGEEVLMTKDHINPKSLGGVERIENMQTMCKVCNEIKMNRV